jgi:prevent-host-death family protein
MKTMTATHASRGFSDVLDQVEHGETIRITRGGRTVAELRPVTPATGRALRQALAAVQGLDDEFERDVVAATELLTDEANGSWPVD